MSLAEIVPALVARLSGTPGIVTVLDYVPQIDLDAAALPAILLDPQAPILTENAARRRITWPIDLICLAAVRSKNGPDDMVIARPLPEAIIGRLDGAVTLGGLLARSIAYPSPAMEPFSPMPWHKTTYLGFVLLPQFTVEITERFGV